LTEEAEVLGAVLIQQMSSEHNVEGVLKKNTGACELEIIMLSILSNQFDISSVKDWLDIIS